MSVLDVYISMLCFVFNCGLKKFYFFIICSLGYSKRRLQHQWKIIFKQPDPGVHLFCVTCCTSGSHMATHSVNLARAAYHN